MSKSPVWQPFRQQKDVKIIDRQLLHDGFYKVRKYTLSHPSFSGAMGPTLEREQMYRQDAAVILLYDPVQDKLILVEQFRCGLLEHRTESPWMIECVAGLIEPNEAPENALYREVKEETGCTLKSYGLIATFYNSPGGFAERTWAYCGIVDASEAQAIAGVKEEQEDILVHQLDAKAVIKAYRQWTTSASTLISLDWFASHYPQEDWVSFINEKQT